MHTVNSVGDKLDAATATAFVSNIFETGIIDKKTARLMLAAVSDKALRPIAVADRDTVRASIFKQLLVTLITE
jgi:transcriptional regulator CtsR